MKTIYSILYVNINTAINERVSIGVLMSNGLDNYFKYSSEKLSIIKNILNDERYFLVRSYLRSLERDIPGGRKKDWINESYLSYLSRYSNNIIQFSSPKTIDITFDEKNFKRIFEKYIFRYEEELRNTNTVDVHAKV